MEDETRQRFTELEMPQSMYSRVEQQPVHERSAAGSILPPVSLLGATPPPLSQQLVEEQNVSEMRAFYERDLDNWFKVQNKSNELMI